MTTTRREIRSPSIWAFLLIAVGVIWLLFEAKALSGANLAVLFRLWPIVLIGFGLELLIGRGARSISLLIGFGTIILLLVLMVVGPALGLASDVEVKQSQYSELIGDATSAQVNLDLSIGQTTVKALSDSKQLITADVQYVGDVNFNVTTSGSQKGVSLVAKNDNVQWFDFLGLSLGGNRNGNDLHWNIGLAPNIPLDLRLNGGVGDSTIDLSALQVSRFSYNTGVGNGTISLPGGGSYQVSVKGGVGNTTVNFATGASVNASLEGGVGNLTLSVPENAPVHLEANSGLGNISVPANFNRLSGSDSGVSHNSVWESPNYASAADSARITITYNGGVGNLTVQ